MDRFDTPLAAGEGCEAPGVARSSSRLVMACTISLDGRLPAAVVAVAADPDDLGGVREVDAVGVGDPQGPLDDPAVAVIGRDVIRSGAAAGAGPRRRRRAAGLAGCP